MHKKTRLIRHLEYIAWMAKLELPANEARQANEARRTLMESLAAKHINSAFRQCKLYYGDLSPGCLTCGQGTWSCLYINHLCTAHCFFCPQDRAVKKESSPVSDGITFDDPEIYLDYLQTLGFKGVGISGGEPLLVFERLVSFIQNVKRRFGHGIYVWMYTNGDLIDAATLQSLKRAGLNEIRFNTCARGYSLRPVALATDTIDTVTIEIPAIPEDTETVKRHVHEMQQAGVRHLILHQLHTTEHNFTQLAGRGYTFIRHTGLQDALPVFESELAALRLMEYILDQHLDLSVSYCAHTYKARFQELAKRKRAAGFAREEPERITDAGYIARLSVKDSPANLTKIAAALKAAEDGRGQWGFDNTGTELVLRHSLLQHINPDRHHLLLQYFEADIAPSKDQLAQKGFSAITEVRLNSQTSIFVGRKPVAPPKGLALAHVETPDTEMFEQVDEGLPVIPSFTGLNQEKLEERAQGNETVPAEGE